MKDRELLIKNGVNVEKSLELFGDIESYNNTLEDFLISVNSKIQNLKKYKELSDMYNYEIVIHDLKNDFNYLGFTRLAEIAYQHELASKNNNIEYIYNNYDFLIDEINKAILLINQYFGKEVIEREEENHIVSNKTILVADDSDIIRNFIGKILKDSYTVKYAKDGSEAISAIKDDADNNILCLFLDLNMPNVNGYKVLEYIKFNNLFDKISVVIITGVDTKEEIAKTFEYPIVDVLGKPFNERDVKNIIDKLLLK